MSTDQTIQLPVDATANKNLLRAFTVNVNSAVAGTTNATLEQVVVLSDADGNVVRAWRGLDVNDDETRTLLGEIRDSLQLIVGLLDK